MKNKLLCASTILFLLIMVLCTCGGSYLRTLFCSEVDYILPLYGLSTEGKNLGLTVPQECIQEDRYVILLKPTEWGYYVAVHQPIREQDRIIDHSGKERIVLEPYVNGTTWKGYVVYGESEVSDGAKLRLGEEKNP